MELMTEMKPKHASGASPKKPISAAAQRALAEAAERPPELGRSGKPDPVRYGDWEIRGIATDF
jgi:hypothetical protein